MNTAKTSALKTFLEYLGRGAVPVDGSYWVDAKSTRQAGAVEAPATTRQATTSWRDNVPLSPTVRASRGATVSSFKPQTSPPLGKCAPAAPGR